MERGDGYCLKHALRVVKVLYGGKPAIEFGPKSLKTCRTAMIRKDWSRSYINAQIDRVRCMFRWAAEEELLPGSVYENLKAVVSLRKGKTEARETERIKPVGKEVVDATKPFLPATVKAMVELQLVTGMRPGEVCILRPIDIDRTDPNCWVYRPTKHKTGNHDIERTIFFGPKAQAILIPHLTMKLARIAHQGYRE